ncbi:MAG TPA: ATP-binding protein [Polyangia bacterium]|nr:ATP-binding protein [Polyangia bacterium]
MQGQEHRGGAPRPREQSNSRTLSGTLRDLEIASAGKEWTEEMQHLVHELEIHRTELEMQNQQLRESRAQLEDSNARYTDLYDFAPVAYLTLDGSGKIEEANLTAAALFRVERAQLIGRALATLVRAESRQVFREHLQTCLNQAARVSHEIEIGARGRIMVPTQITSTPIIGAQGYVVGCKTTLTDISALKRAQEVLKFLGEASTVLASSFDYPATASVAIRLAVPLLADVAILDIFDAGLLQRIEVANADSRRDRLTAAAREARPPRGARTAIGWVLKTHEPLLLADCRPSAPTAQADGFEHESFVRACSPRSLMYVPIASRGHVLGVLTFVMAESDRRFDAEQLASATELANRIALAIENARLYDAATRAVKAREEVLSFVSHDLENPLMAILLTTEMLLGSAPDNERRRGWKQLDRIRRGVKQMRHMVEDLLDISSIDAGRLSMEMGEHPVQAVLEDALELLQPVAKDKAISLTTQVSCSDAKLRCDRDRLVQVLFNLVGNALKFTPEGGEVLVSAKLSGERAVVAVRDSGPGIPPRLVPHLFQRYVQDQRTARRGRGLGLYICRGIIQAHGGTIWVDTAVGQGSTFSFTVPLASTAEVAKSSPMDSRHDSGDALPPVAGSE